MIWKTLSLEERVCCQAAYMKSEGQDDRRHYLLQMFCRCLSQEVTAANAWPLKICPMLSLAFVPEILIPLLKYWLCLHITYLNQRREVSKKLMYNHYIFCLEASFLACVACHNSSYFLQPFTFWIEKYLEHFTFIVMKYLPKPCILIVRVELDFKNTSKN